MALPASQAAVVLPLSKHPESANLTHTSRNQEFSTERSKMKIHNDTQANPRPPHLILLGLSKKRRVH